MLATNMAKIYLDFKDSHKEDYHFNLPTHPDKGDSMRDAYITCFRIGPMWSLLCNTSRLGNGVRKDNMFLYKKNKNEKWMLVLLSMFDINS